LGLYLKSEGGTADNTTDFELSMLNTGSTTQPIEVMTSDLYATHFAETQSNPESSSDAFAITVNYMVQMLIQEFGTVSDSLASKLRAVSQKVAARSISTVRHMELELLQAGKNDLPTQDLFDGYIPEVRRLCDSMYSQQSSTPRTKYHKLGVALVDSLMQSIDTPSIMLSTLDTSAQIGDGSLDYALGIQEDSDPLAEFLKEFDNSAFSESFQFPSGPPLDESASIAVDMAVRTVETTKADSTTIHDDPVSPEATKPPVFGVRRPMPATKDHKQKSSLPTAIPPVTPTTPATVSEGPTAPTPAEAGPSEQKTEANDCCEICGYRPKGDPQWFKGSMAKHKKLQHSTEPPKIYRCTFPGCTSAYKNRPDNLRQHQIEKGHFVDGEGKQKRLGKRKKMDDD
jgi:hypothetical protein